MKPIAEDAAPTRPASLPASPLLSPSLQGVLDSLPAQLAVLDARGLIVSVNAPWRAFAAANGAPADTVWLGADYLAECDRAARQGAPEAADVARAIRRILAGEKTAFEFTYPCNSPTETRWFRARVLPFESEGHSFITLAHENITRRVLAEQAVKQSEERLRLSTAATNDVVWDWDLRHNTLFWNENFEVLFGYPEAEFPSLAEWKDLIHPDDRDAVVAGLEAAVANDDQQWSDEYRLRRRDGSYATIWDRGFLIRDDHGRSIRMVGAMADVSERKRVEEQLRRSEERFELAVRGSGVGLWDFNLQTGEWYYSPRCREILGHVPGVHPPLPNSIESFELRLHPEDRERVIGALRAHLHEGTPYDVEYRALLDSGEYRWLHVTGQALAEPNSLPYRMAGSLVDVTDRKRAAVERERLEQQLRQSQKMEAVGTLAGGIAHDFNNILSTIIGYAELAQDNLADPAAAARDLQQILKAADRAADLVRHLLTFSRQEDLVMAPLALQAAARDVLTLIRATLPTTIDLIVDFPPEEVVIRGNSTQIHQVLLNLAANAAHALQGRTGHVRITMESVPPPGPDPRWRAGAVSLRFSDNGRGIPAEVLERIFDPFFTTKAPGEGSGLGLAVVDGIVRSHGGTISVTSEPGHGTEFVIVLPRDGGELVAALAPAPLAARGGGQRVLLVDDEPALGQALQRGLQQLGFRVTYDSSSASALARFSAAPDDFDVVVTDQVMPTMEGDTLARLLLARRPELPIVLMTGYRGGADRARLQAGGVREVWMKPLTTVQLAAAINRSLRAAG